MFSMKATAFLGVIAIDHGVSYYQLYDKAVDCEKFKQFLHGFRYRNGKREVVF